MLKCCVLAATLSVICAQTPSFAQEFSGTSTSEGWVNSSVVQPASTPNEPNPKTKRGCYGACFGGTTVYWECPLPMACFIHCVKDDPRHKGCVNQGVIFD